MKHQPNLNQSTTRSQVARRSNGDGHVPTVKALMAAMRPGSGRQHHEKTVTRFEMAGAAPLFRIGANMRSTGRAPFVDVFAERFALHWATTCFLSSGDVLSTVTSSMIHLRASFRFVSQNQSQIHSTPGSLTVVKPPGEETQACILLLLTPWA